MTSSKLGTKNRSKASETEETQISLQCHGRRGAKKGPHSPSRVVGVCSIRPHLSKVYVYIFIYVYIHINHSFILKGKSSLYVVVTILVVDFYSFLLFCLDVFAGSISSFNLHRLYHHHRHRPLPHLSYCHYHHHHD